MQQKADLANPAMSPQALAHRENVKARPPLRHTGAIPKTDQPPKRDPLKPSQNEWKP